MAFIQSVPNVGRKSRAPQMILLSAVLLGACAATGCEKDGLLGSQEGPLTDLGITMTASTNNPEAGGFVDFTIRVQNFGPEDASAVYVGDTLADGLEYHEHVASVGSFDPTEGIWEIGSLALDGTAELIIRALVGDRVGDTDILVRAGVISSYNPDSLLDNNIAEVVLSIPPTPGDLPPAPPAPPPLPPPAPPSPPSVGLVFESDWGTATGSSSAALTDGGKWNKVYCTASNVLSVVSGSTVGFSGSTNVLRVQQRGEMCGMLERTNVVPASTTHWGRFYFRNDEQGSGHGHPTAYHPVPQGSEDFQAIPWKRDTYARNGRILIGIQTWRYQYPHVLWTLNPGLQNGTWFRYEWMMEYVTSTTYRLWPRLYDMNGQLLYTAKDWRQEDYGIGSLGTHTLESWYTAGNVFTLSRSPNAVSPSNARNFGIGNEGPATSANTQGYWYHAKVAFSTSGWIGQ